jgi:hypothetical protein
MLNARFRTARRRRKRNPGGSYVTLPVQVNGKLRGALQPARDASETRVRVQHGVRRVPGGVKVLWADANGRSIHVQRMPPGPTAPDSPAAVRKSSYRQRHRRRSQSISATGRTRPSSWFPITLTVGVREAPRQEPGEAARQTLQTARVVMYTVTFVLATATTGFIQEFLYVS